MAGVDFKSLFDSRRFTREQAESLILLAEDILLTRPVSVTVNSAPAAWTDMPAIATPLFGEAAGGRAFVADLSGYSEIRISVAVVATGHSTAILYPAIAVASPMVAGSYTAVASSAALSAAGVINGGWAAIPIALRQQIGYVGIFGSGGNGIADPTIGAVTVWMR